MRYGPLKLNSNVDQKSRVTVRIVEDNLCARDSKV